MYNAQFVSALKEALNGLRTIHAVGEEWCSYIGQIPVGGVPYCGQEVTRSTYSALWQYAQNQGLVKSESEWQAWASSHGGNVPYYSSGNGSSTFRMPRIVGYVRGASGQSEAGSYVKEGLPNITGSLTSNDEFGLFAPMETIANGAFVRGTVAGQRRGSNGASTFNPTSVNFDASRSNSIYGNSNHVTPETSVVLFGVFAFGEVSNVDALDASTLASALARVESNIQQALNKPNPVRYVVEKWSSGTSWYTKYSDGWVEQGGIASATAANAKSTVTFNVAFSSTNYALVASMHQQDGKWMNGVCLGVDSRTVSNFTCYFSSLGNDSGMTGIGWYACGY